MRSAKPKNALINVPATKPSATPELINAAWVSLMANSARNAGRTAAAENHSDSASTWAKAMSATDVHLPVGALAPFLISVDIQTCQNSRTRSLLGAHLSSQRTVMTVRANRRYGWRPAFSLVFLLHRRRNAGFEAHGYLLPIL